MSVTDEQLSNLLADQVSSDPRVHEAKRLIDEVIREHQAQLNGPRLADPSRKQAYEDMIQGMGQARGLPMYYRYLGSGFGKGALVELADGSVKYDFITGIGVHFLGHSHPDLVSAGIDAAISDTVMQGNLQQEQHNLHVASQILELAKAGGSKLRHCFLTTSGAMANENALKLIFQKKQPADRLLAFEGCFMGRSLALSQVSDKPAYRQGLPRTLSVDHVPFFDPACPSESTARTVEALKTYLRRYPGQHAAMCMELVLGEGGNHVGDATFFRAIIDELKAHCVAVMVDEIQTFGRTSCPFAFQHFEIGADADVVTIGKLSQVCATLYTDELIPKPGLISQTFTGSTASIHAAGVVFSKMLDGGWYGPGGRIETARRRFVDGLKAIAKRHPGWVHGPFGVGAMVAITAFNGLPAITKRFVLELYEAGVIAFPAGADPTRVRFLMPIGAVTDEDIDAVCGIIEQTLIKVSDTTDAA